MYMIKNFCFASLQCINYFRGYTSDSLDNTMYGRRHSRYDTGKQLKWARMKYWVTLALAVMISYFVYRALFAKFSQNSPLTVDRIRKDHDRQLSIIRAETRTFHKKNTDKYKPTFIDRPQKSTKDINELETNGRLNRGNAIKPTEWREITILDNKKNVSKIDRKTPVNKKDNESETFKSKNTSAGERYRLSETDAEKTHNIHRNYSSVPLGQLNLQNLTKKITLRTSRNNYTSETMKDEQLLGLPITQSELPRPSGNSSVSLTSTNLKYTSLKSRASNTSIGRSMGKEEPKATYELLSKLNSTSASNTS